jgi:hypothetical protein
MMPSPRRLPHSIYRKSRPTGRALHISAQKTPQRPLNRLTADRKSNAEDWRQDRQAQALDHLPGAEVMVPRTLFQQILDAIAALRSLPPVRH